MNRLIRILITLSIFTAIFPRALHAKPKDDTVVPDDAKTKDDGKPKSTLTVAVLDFDAAMPGGPELGKQISEAITATLSGEVGFTLVDRAAIGRTLAENELNRTGLVNADQAIKIGKLVGAKIIITGKIFPLDKQLFLTAKLIGTETSLVEGVLVRGEKDTDMGELMMKLSERVAARLRESGPKLIAADETIEDPLPHLKKLLMGRKLPVIAIRVQENHITGGPVARIDPAVETELRIVLKDAGFTVIEGDEKDLADAGVAMILSGEAFSEFAARIGNLLNCAARVELKLTDRKTREVLYSDRETTRAVDLSENIASKTALQKAGHLLAIRILRHFADTLPGPAKGKAAGKEPPEK